MEIKVSKEIREYRERVFFGLSTRQFACALGAMGAAAGAYFLFNQRLGQEVTSWLCILCAAPVAVAGFFRYNGMTLERFVLAWLKSQVFRAGRRLYSSVNYYDARPTKTRLKRRGCKHVFPEKVRRAKGWP